MHRYFGFVWDELDQRATSRAHPLSRLLRANSAAWRPAFASNGLVVLHCGQPVRRFQDYELSHRGTVLGTLFRRSPTQPLVATDVEFNEREIRALVDSRGQHLVENYWGRYVAFVRTAPSECIVIRDPTGALPCFCAKVDGVNFFFSHMEDFRAVHALDLSINWRHIGAFLHYNRLVSRETGFAEITQVQAGERIEIKGDQRKSTFCWHPARFCQSNVIEDRKEAIRELRAATEACVEGWSTRYGHILHELSGGLDSSIVLSCLANAKSRPAVTCFNLYTETAEGDERSFARLAAACARCELVEQPVQPVGEIPTIDIRASQLATPVLVSLLPKSESARAALAKQRGTEAIFSGQGGDHLFQQRKNAMIAAEYVHRHGFRHSVARTLMNTARMTRTSVWSVLRTAIAHGLFRRSVDPYEPFKPPSFLRHDVGIANDIRHQWVDDAEDLPAAKRQQIFDVVDCQIFWTYRCDYADIVHPLISLPLIESSLRIPTYVLTDGGRARGLARDAFADELPAKISARTSKGGATGYYHNMILGNAKFVGEFLLGGLLAQEGLLNRDALASALSEDQIVRGEHLNSVLKALLAEAWARESTNLSRRAVAA